MSDTKAAWDELGDRFTELGRRIKDRYDANVAFGEDEKQRLDDAFAKLGDALETAFGAIGETMRDADIRAELKQTADALTNAVTTTLRTVADQIKR